MATPIQLVETYLEADIPVLIWGPPGTGKTSAINASARRADAMAEFLIGSTLDPIDVGGYFIPVGKNVESSPPPWARRIRQALDSGRKAWLVLDELSCAPPSVQAALLRVVNERRVGELSIEGCRIVAASNPADSAADGGELAAATANRWAHVNWGVSAPEWVSGTIGNWGDGWKSKAAAQAAASIAAWISKSPKSLMDIPKGAGAGRAYPSPRSWTQSIKALSVNRGLSERELVAGCVGEAAAMEWHTYHLSRDLPDAADILSGRASVPQRGDRANATLLAVIAHVAANKNLVPDAWKLLAQQRPDVALSAAAALLDLCGGEVPDEAVELAGRITKAGG